MSSVFEPTPRVSVPIVGKSERFCVHRVYCLARNYKEHAKEMGFSGEEAPFFFQKPADPEALVVADAGETKTIRYPSLTARLHHEIELVIALGVGGQNIALADALSHVFGYAVGLDMTRQDLLNELSQKGRPWCVGKAFDHSAVIGPITEAAQTQEIERAEIHLLVNGEERQRSNLAHLIWGVAKLIEQLSEAFTLLPGDLIFTGTPSGVGPVVPGDLMQGGIRGLIGLQARVG
jgi:fumarylpyruvate hydrolase